MADVTTTGPEIPVDQSTLSPNFAPYVYGMLGKGWEAANIPFQPFGGQRFAFSNINPATGQYEGGYSPLEQQAFSGLGALGAYAPTQFSAGYAPPALSGATQFGNQFTAPGAYTPTQFSTGLGPVGSVQSYMSPYMSAVTDIEAREARRQADISRNAEQARLAQAGAFGGSRQAIMEAERQRNLGQQIGDITSRGLQGAYDRAMEQRLKESALGLESQRYGEQAQQFGAQQGMTAAQSAAQYGLAGLQQTEAARQFQEQQRARAAELGATLGLEAQRGTEASRQFGATYGLRSLADQIAAGKEQRAIAQQPLDFGYQQFEKSVAAPRESATFMSSLLQGLPVRANPYLPATQGESAAASAISGGLGAYNLMNYFGNIGKKP
jgi:hypothetical protein